MEKQKHKLEDIDNCALLQRIITVCLQNLPRFVYKCIY